MRMVAMHLVTQQGQQLLFTSRNGIDAKKLQISKQRYGWALAGGQQTHMPSSTSAGF